MKVPKRPPRRLEVFRSFADFARASGIALTDPSLRDAFVGFIDDVIANDASRGTVLHGSRTQAMFGFVAQALQACASITEEDAGEFLGPNATTMQRPDYRIITTNGDKFFVEVKNHHPKGESLEPLLMKPAYLNRLTAYAELHGLDLKFAVYWSRWNIWTLVPPTAFSSRRKGLALTFEQAMTRNEMHVLGDYHVGIEPPISIRIYSDPTQPRSMSPAGETTFTIGRVSIVAGGRDIDASLEQQLALYFMFYGTWNDVEQPCHMENGELIWVEFVLSPDLPEPAEGCEMIGIASGLASQRYKELTRRGDNVSGIFTDADPVALCPRVPEGYKGDVLKLAIIRMLPKRS